jgi:hypothetical protein
MMDRRAAEMQTSTEEKRRSLAMILRPIGYVTWAGIATLAVGLFLPRRPVLSSCA